MASPMTDRLATSPDVLEAYTAMLRIRVVEETILAMRLAGTIVGSVHLEMGQEAVPVGVVGARQPGDAVFSTYRGHGWALACGLPVQSLLAELAGRVGGPNDGRGGSAYFSDPGPRVLRRELHRRRRRADRRGGGARRPLRRHRPGGHHGLRGRRHQPGVGARVHEPRCRDAPAGPVRVREQRAVGADTDRRHGRRAGAVPAGRGLRHARCAGRRQRPLRGPGGRR